MAPRRSHIFNIEEDDDHDNHDNHDNHGNKLTLILLPCVKEINSRAFAYSFDRNLLFKNRQS
jgi:hypothetical protein